MKTEVHERRKRSNRAKAGEPGLTSLNSSGLFGLTLATCAEVDPNCNHAHSDSTAEGERSVQEDSGEWMVLEPHTDSSRRPAADFKGFSSGFELTAAPLR